MSRVAIEGSPDLVRDITSGAIIYTKKTHQKEQAHLHQRYRHKSLERRLDALEESIEDIKEMLTVLIHEKINTQEDIDDHG